MASGCAFFHNHGTPANLVGVRLNGFRQRFVGFGQQMVRHEIRNAVEPKMGEHRQHFALTQNTVRHHDIVGADAVARDHQEAIA